MKSKFAMLACAALLAGATAAQAQQEVKIGVLYPLSGPTAQIGVDAVAAVKTVLEIVNDGADLPLPLAKSKGLPGLGGAKVTVIVVDHQGKPEVGLSETERLISQEKVHAMFGAYFSSVTAAASQAAERAGVPFLNAESSQPALTTARSQVLLPHLADGRDVLAADVRLPEGLRRQEGREVRDGLDLPRGHRVRHRQRQGAGEAGGRGRHEGAREDHLQGADDVADLRGAAPEGRQRRRAAAVLLHVRHVPAATGRPRSWTTIPS